MSFKRREFLKFLGAGTAGIVCGSLADEKFRVKASFDTAPANAANHGLTFKPISYPIPLEIDGLSPEQQKQAYQSYEVVDDLVLPFGFTYDVIASWGDRVGESRFGYNNDYISFIETSTNEGFLTINFENISALTWKDTYELVMGKKLPEGVLEILALAGDRGIDVFFWLDGRPLKAQFQEFFKQVLIDQGIGIVSIRRNADGRWERTYSAQDRRITGISGWEDGRYLKVTGPAAAVFRKSQGLGYIDGLGDKIIGTFSNCAGGTTPWGTVFSAEENIQDSVPEAVKADGTSMPPAEKTLKLSGEGQGNPFGLAGNKYGWMVEIDPAEADDYGTKHTWLGRFRHEAVGIRVETGRPLAFYSGCDRRGGHLYKFVSAGKVVNTKDKHNSRLLDEGMLYAAKFYPGGRGEWIPLRADTPVNPELPGNHHGGMLPLPNPNRQVGGFVKVRDDREVVAFKQKFARLGELYFGESAEEIQGAILIDAHFAANAVGATCTARPEDTVIRPGNGALFIAFTSGSPGGDGGPDKRFFSNSKGEVHEYGWLMRLEEEDNNPGAVSFRWQMLGMGGEPSEGGLGFSNPDNLEFDARGNLWMVTDISTSQHNKAVPAEGVEGQGSSLNPSERRGVFGNNSIWFIPLSGPNAGKAYPFGMAPMETETCGPFFTRDQQTLFAAIQHPGEKNGIRRNMASQTRQFSVLTTDGQELIQNRQVPLGSNWPGKGVNDPPKPSVVAIRRLDGRSLS